MSSPKARPRQRSTRVVSASALVVIAAVVVLGAVLSGSQAFLSVAAVLAVVLGAAAVPITHPAPGPGGRPGGNPSSDPAPPRRDTAADRARQAPSYRAMAEARSAEHQEF